jgi:O-antigen/teichoic acid export membrane protein
METMLSLMRVITPRPLLPFWERFESSPWAARLAHGLFWSSFGAVASRGLAIVSSIIVARVLGAEMFGELGIIQSTLTMFTTFATVGIGLTAAKYIAELRRTDTERAGRVLGLSNLISWISGAVVACVLAVGAPWIAAHTLSAPHLGELLRLSSVCLLFMVVTETQTGALSGFEAFRRRSVVQLVVGVVSFPITVIGVYLVGLGGAVVALAMTQGILVLWNCRAIRMECKLQGIKARYTGLSREFAVLWGFSLPTLLGGALYVPAIWCANTIIVSTPNGYGEMGVFGAADRWRTAIMFAPVLLGGVALPMLSTLNGRTSSREYYRVLWMNVRLSCFVAFGVAIPIAAFSPWIMASFGPGFAGGTSVLVLLCGSALLTAVGWILSQSLISKGRMWLQLCVHAGWAGAFLSLVWLSRFDGARGMALSYLIADSLRLVLLLLLIGLHQRSETGGQ